MITCLTCATERVESPPSTWAATPETCGAAMLVPLKKSVLVLLEPVTAALIPEPGACACVAMVRGGGAGDGGAARGGGRTCGAGGQAEVGRPLCGWKACATSARVAAGGGGEVCRRCAQCGGRGPARGRKRRSWRKRPSSLAHSWRQRAAWQGFWLGLLGVGVGVRGRGESQASWYEYSRRPPQGLGRAGRGDIHTNAIG